MSVEGRTNKAPALFFYHADVKIAVFYQYLPCLSGLIHILICNTKIGEKSDMAKS